MLTLKAQNMRSDMIKISIVTVYNSLNYGGYLQAYALNQILKQVGGHVSFLETKARNPLRETLRSTIEKLLSFKFRNAIFLVKKYLCLREAVNMFTICSTEVSLREQDIFVFGSDEIWNISRKKIRDYPVFLGVGIPDSYLVSYAVSINTTELKQIKEHNFFIDSIEKFNKISVRDEHTLNTIKSAIAKDISLVLDPTFLLSRDTYDLLEEDCAEKDYVLIYSYGDKMNEEKIKQIKSFAKSKAMKLISVGFYLEWCDKSMAVSPFLFLSYIKKASFIITDTFHGTVFSIIYNKPFVAYGGNSTKINEVLKQFGLETRNAQDETVLKSIFETSINYKDVNVLIETYKNASFEYIHSFVEDYKASVISKNLE